jgi:hypothetical protein
MSANHVNSLAWVGCAVLLCGVLLGVFVLGRPVLIEIPGDYKRWIVIRVDDTHCPPLTTRGLFRVVSVPISGKVCTSSPELLKRPTYVRFEYVYPDGRRQSLPWSGNRSDTRAKVWWSGHGIELHEDYIFVGDVREMNNSGSPMHYDSPSPGK